MNNVQYSIHHHKYKYQILIRKHVLEASFETDYATDEKLHFIDVENRAKSHGHVLKCMPYPLLGRTTFSTEGHTGIELFAQW